MKKISNKMRVMREGATLVTVVIATAFLIAIGVVILTASTKYLVSVYMDRNTNDNMYSAEGILSEVRAGLLEYAGDAGLTTYKEIMEDYEKYKGNAGSEFGKRFVCRIGAKLQGTSSFTLNPTTDIYYDGTTTEESMTDAMKKSISLPQLQTLSSYGVPADDDDKAKKKNPVTSKYNFDKRLNLNPTTTEEEETQAQQKNDVYFVIHFSPTRGYYLVIKNLVIDYLDDANYRTAIQTDIQINAPDYKFEGGKTLDEAKDYIVIADDTLKVDGSAGDIEFNGNIYTGANIDENTGADVLKKSAPGIVVNDKYDSSVKAHFNCDKLISRGNLEIYKGGIVSISGQGSEATSSDTVTGEVYLRNIKLISKTPNEDLVVDGSGNIKHSELDLKANAYIENDLDIRDSNAIVTLGGNYYGYSYNKTNTYAGGNAIGLYDSTYSSAILVNGYNTEIKTAKDEAGHDILWKLVLSGRAFVERSHGANEKNDIITGQSIAVKSDQIAYLVPDRYLISEHNPVTLAEAGSDFSDPTRLIKEEYRKNNFAKLKNEFKDDKGTFLCEGITNGTATTKDISSPPVTGDYKAAANGENYAFVFLNFKNEKRANDFFKYFYTDTARQSAAASKGDITANDLNDRARPYITNKSSGVKIDPALYLISGNILRSYDGNGFTESKEYFTDSTDASKPSQDLLDEGNGIGRRYMNLISKLTAGDMTNISSTRFEDLQPDDKKRVVTAQMFDFTVSPFPSIPLTSNRVDAKTGAKIYCSDTDLTIDSADEYGGKLDTDEDSVKKKSLIITKGKVDIGSGVKLSGLIISGGDVTIHSSAEFDGLIISGGVVQTDYGVKLKSDHTLVGKLFEYMQTDPDLCKLIRGRANALTDNDKEIEKCIRYLDWQKNTY